MLGRFSFSYSLKNKGLIYPRNFRKSYTKVRKPPGLGICTMKHQGFSKYLRCLKGLRGFVECLVLNV